MNPRTRRQARALQRLQLRTGARLSDHASERAEELGFSLAEVLECIASPEQTYVSGPRYGPDRRVYQRRQVAVVVHEPTRVAITVLLRQSEHWVHGQHSRMTMRFRADLNVLPAKVEEMIFRDTASGQWTDPISRTRSGSEP